jgi:phosphatidylglycerol---prolipoprotein diacylglyceryl transferase
VIPWIESHAWNLGPLTFQTWGTFVAAGYLLGTCLAARRARQKKLDEKIIWDLSFWFFLAAFIGARLFHVLFYEPAYYATHPFDAFNLLKPGFAIEGAFLACAAVFAWFVKKKRIDPLTYADTFVWGIPWGCGVGRIGCFLIHDHPGTLSHAIIAVRYPDGQSRHDLGLDLSIVGFTIGLIFLALDRQKRKPGFFTGAFLVLDSASRLWLDFYRIADVRYFHLTPTQWLSIPLIGVGGWLILRSCTTSS